jgi:hypothetical protein
MCAVCSEVVCARCAARTQRCFLAPSCAVSLCGSCVDPYHSRFFTRCDDCDALACPTHTHICRDCTTEPNRYLPPGNDVFGVRPLGSDGRRAMMQCCACKRTYCQACDPGRTGQAGDAGRATRLYDPEDADDVGCVFCCSWPRFCTGLARDNMESLQDELDEQKSDTERAAAAAQDRAAAAAVDATAAAVAATAADVAAHAAAASAHAAQEAAQEAALQEEELRHLQAQLDAAQAALR